MTSSPLGVVIVSFNGSDVILPCLETLFSAAEQDGTPLRVVVVDNASSDGTPTLVADWAAGRHRLEPPEDLPFAHHPPRLPLDPEGPRRLEVLEAGSNGGFAAGVNLGLARLFADPQIARVWVLNPDSVVPPGTPRAFATTGDEHFALMGGRITFYEAPDMLQSDGGRIGRWTGVTHNIHHFQSAARTPEPNAAALDFISGASLVVSRRFYETRGPMPEEYFLYYEEVAWAKSRGDLPLRRIAGAPIYHRGGSTIGSGIPGRPASPFSLYFMYRARMIFLRRFYPAAQPTAWLYIIAKLCQFRLKGWHAEAEALLAGARRGPPPAAVRARLDPEAARRAFGP